jgi:hypothetical protein
MDITNITDENAYKLIEAARRSLVATNMAFCEIMNQGIISTYESVEDGGGYMVMGIRPNCTLVAAAKSKGRIIWSEMHLKKPEVEIHQKMSVLNLPNEEQLDQWWDIFMDNIETWTRGDVDTFGMNDGIPETPL